MAETICIGGVGSEIEQRIAKYRAVNWAVLFWRQGEGQYELKDCCLGSVGSRLVGAEAVGDKRELATRGGLVKSGEYLS